MKNIVNLQDAYLNQIRKEKVPVTIYLISGIQLKGMINGFDNFVILLENMGRQQIVYKHAVSTIVPQKNVNMKVINDIIEQD